MLSKSASPPEYFSPHLGEYVNVLSALDKLNVAILKAMDKTKEVGDDGLHISTPSSYLSEHFVRIRYAAGHQPFRCFSVCASAVTVKPSQGSLSHSAVAADY